MKFALKMFYSILLICGSGLVLQMVKGAMGTKHSTGGVGPFIIVPLLIIALPMIWKDKSKDDDGEDSNANTTITEDTQLRKPSSDV